MDYKTSSPTIKTAIFTLLGIDTQAYQQGENTFDCSTKTGKSEEAASNDMRRKSFMLFLQIFFIQLTRWKHTTEKRAW